MHPDAGDNPRSATGADTPSTAFDAAATPGFSRESSPTGGVCPEKTNSGERDAMNKVFSRVWNRSLQALVVASELARGSGKAGRASVTAGLVVLSAGMALAPAALAAGDGATACDQASAGD